MNRWVESLVAIGRSGELRPTAEIEGDILEELRFHLEERTADNVAAGMSIEEARADAEERFGDFRRIRADCRRVQLGERIMLQRINFVAVLVLLGAVVVFGLEAVQAQRDAGHQVAAMREEMNDQMDLMLALLAQQAETDARAEVGSGAIGRLLEGDTLAPELDASSERVEVQTPFDPLSWLERVPPFDASLGDAVALAREIAELPPDQAIEVLETIWGAVENPAHRQQLLKYARRGPHFLRAMHLGASDETAEVRGWAYNYLKDVAFIEFGEDPTLYDVWHRRFAGLPLDQVIATSATEFVGRVNQLDGDALAKALRQFDRLDLRIGEGAGLDMNQVLRDAGVLMTIERWMQTGTLETREVALDWLSHIQPTEQELRHLALPVLTDPTVAPELHSTACRTLGRPDADWAVDPLLGFMLGELSQSAEGLHSSVWSGAMALAEIGDHRAIPELIGMIAADDTYDTVYGVGYFGLRDLTGVNYDESHTGEWWLAWWESNRHRYPPEVAVLEVPE